MKCNEIVRVAGGPGELLLSRANLYGCGNHSERPALQPHDGSQAKRRPEQLRRESANTLLKRMMTLNLEAVVGKDAVHAAKAALAATSA